MAIAWQDTSRTIQRYQITPTLAIADGTLGCTGWCWSFLRDLEKGGVNRAVLGLWFPWTEVPETSQENDISLMYRVMLSLTCVLLVIRRRCLASPFAVFQSSFHSFLIVCLIRLTLAVFSDLCLKGIAFMPLDCAAAFAALSAISFPSMSL